MGNYLLSVDGGGTKTEFCISDMEGNLCESVIEGCSNYKSVGVEAVYESFRTGIDRLADKGIPLTDIRYSVWGISGCDSEHDFQLLRDILGRLGIDKDRCYLCNDGILAFYAQAREPGIVVIAGTGSIILGIDRDGNYMRASGWGYNISDIGSGYWIGAEVLKRTLLYCDGCSVHSLLYDKVREYFSSGDFEHLPYIVTEVTDFYEIAKLAQLAVEVAEQGENTALGILGEGAGVLSSLMHSIYRRMDFDGEMDLNIVFSGGVLKSGIYQRLIKQELGKRIPLKRVSFSTQKNAPAYGGIRLAQRILKQGIKREGKLGESE